MRQFIITLLLCVSAGSVSAAPFAYSVNSNSADSVASDRLYRIDLATGEATQLNKVRLNEPLLNSDLEGLAFAPDGKLYGVDDADETLLIINTTTGIGESVNGARFNLQLEIGTGYDFGLTFTCDGSLLLAADEIQTLYQLDENVGTASIIGGLATLNVPITALAAWGDKVYGLGQGEFSETNPLPPSLYEIDVITGKTTLIGELGGAVKLYRNGGLSFDTEGQLWAITDRFNLDNNQDFPSQIIKIDTTTGLAEAIAESSVIGFESLAISGPGGCGSGGYQREVPIPVLSGPSSLIMMILMLFVGGYTLRNWL